MTATAPSAYPTAARTAAADDLHGTTVPDPYRWLEDPADPATAAWSEAQDGLVRPFLDGRPGRAHLERRLQELMPGVITAPEIAGDREFFLRRAPGQDMAVLVVREAGEDRVLLDPMAIDPSGTTTLDAWVPSPDGTRLAYHQSEGGTEEPALRVIDVATGEVLDGPVDCGRAFSLAWLPGGEEYVYVRRIADAPAGESHFHRRVWRRRIGTPVADDVLLFGEGRDRSTYYGVDVSPDGRWLVVSAAVGTEPRNDLYLFDLSSPAGVAPVTVQEGEDVATHGSVKFDGRLWLLTDRDAPRKRLVVADPESPRPEHWRDVIGESDAVLTGAAVLDGAVVAAHTRDVVTELTVVDPTSGAVTAKVALPGLGTASVRGQDFGGTTAWITYTDFVTAGVILRHDAMTGETATWERAPATPGVALPDLVVRQVFVSSTDGTRVPMFVIARADVIDAEGPHPTVLYGYGGFNVPMSPAYSASITTWAEAGGVWCVANLRGGSEYGEEWHRAGMRERKQNVFDDFISCAEHLTTTGITDVDHLGIQGGSNGGLLVGAALTQRPDLFRAVVCSAPLLDMVRYEHHGLGITWNDEYGSAAIPEELGWLLSYSPYHRVVEGTPYPAVLFTVFENDTRVDPLHARKLCAALQWATSSAAGERPVLIRREGSVGHGARAVSRTVELSVDTMSFMADQLGLALS